MADAASTGTDGSPPTGNVWVDVVDLRTGASRKALFARAFGESGTFTVAFGADGRALVSSSFAGSGSVPLRLYDPATDTSSVVTSSIEQDTMLTASADGSVIGFAESNISDGPFGDYTVATGSYVEKSGYADGTSAFNYEIGVSRDGTQFAIPTYEGTYICDASLVKTGTVIGAYAGAQPIGVVYSPVANLVYFPFAATTQVRAYDTTTWTQVAAYDFGDTFSSPGNHAFVNGRMKISRDGTLLFGTVTGGVRYLALSGPTATAQSVSAPINTPITITLGATGTAGAVTYTIVSPPQNGTLTGTPPNVTYTPDTNFQGQDSFTFQAADSAGPSQPATVSIQVGPGDIFHAATHLLWNHAANGQASLWTLDNTGALSADTEYGPFAGWTVLGLAEAPGGEVHLLWNHTADGQVSVWNVNADGTYGSHQYGPYPGWRAASLSVGADSKVHLLWRHLSDGQAALWDMDSQDPFGAFSDAEYGPYAGWTASTVSSGATVTDLLWTKADGTASGYRIAADGSLAYHLFGPYAGWTATALSVGPDDGAHLLWDKSDGTAALWSVDFTSGAFTPALYGPFPGWTARALATGPDNISRLLWNKTDGTANLWAVNANSVDTSHVFGPYSGWTAVGLSAGP